jgi:hypothetical protein
MTEHDEGLQEWNPCGFYGHAFEDGYCADCGEHQEEDYEGRR